MSIFTESETRGLVRAVLLRAGVPACNVGIQVDMLMEAELRGVASHGLLRLERIVARIANGVADPVTAGTHHWRAPGFLAVDGERGLGPVVAFRALDALCERAGTNGVAVAAIRNSNHIGMLGWYVEEVARKGFSAIALSTSEALVHPWGAKRAVMGTNPIAIAVPTGDDAPFMMDTATSLVSMGEIHDHANRGAAIPLGWALDADGNPTTDAVAAKAGAIAPLGGAKGYALGLAFELLVAALSGAAVGADVVGTLDADRVCTKGDVFIVMDGPNPDLRGFLQGIRDLEPADGFPGVLVPGERGRDCKRRRQREGLPIPDALWSRMQELAGATAPAETS